MKKSELRQIYLDRRKALVTDTLREKSRRISELFFSDFDLSKIRVTHVYISIEKFHEVDTSFVIDEVWSRVPDVTVVAPRIHQQKGEIASVPYGPDTKLIENGWGIREPAGQELADPAKIDLVIVPLLCFDVLGNRVGYGKGYYDRFLARFRRDCLKVGLSLFPPVDPIDDIHEGDVPLDACVTPSEAFRFNRVNQIYRLRS